MQNNPLKEFIVILEENFLSGKLVKATLSKNRQKKSELKNMIISPVQLKTGLMLHFVFRQHTFDITKNYSLEQGRELLEGALQNDFFHGDIYTTEENIRLLINKKGNGTLLRKKVSSPAHTTLSHDREKQRKIEVKNNIWLRELGITNAEGTVRHEMRDKYLQINRYIELLEPEIAKINHSQKLSIADMGSGKGYLTFAMYDYLKNQLKLEVDMTGIEYRSDLVELCNEVSSKSGFTGLQFLECAIEKAGITQTDILIALHACDTATDEAIYKGIGSGAQLIVCAPCCHKQVRKDMAIPGELATVTKHGILMERQAELLTDGIRALIMEAHGYKTRVFEFISSEHTSKNLMITGRKTALGQGKKEKALQNIRAIKKQFGIEKHYLEQLTGMDQ